jgi:hypothetical protein
MSHVDVPSRRPRRSVANTPILRPVPMPGDPAAILRPLDRQPRNRWPAIILFGAVAFGALELIKPYGFSPMLTIGKAIANTLEPQREATLRADLCYQEQQRIAQRLAEAEQEYADAIGQCSYIGTFGVLIDPQIGTMGRTVCEQGINDRFRITLRQLREARERSRQCQL